MSICDTNKENLRTHLVWAFVITTVVGGTVAATGITGGGGGGGGTRSLYGFFMSSFFLSEILKPGIT